jgi:phospholipid transport system substrate-binding protein
MYRFALAVLLSAALGAPAWGGQSAQALLEETTGHVIAQLQEQRDAIRQDPQRAHRLIDELLMPHVDLPRIARFVLGPVWREATPAQRERFTQEFRLLLLRTYGNAMREYIDEVADQARTARVTYAPVREATDPAEATVRSAIETPAGQSYSVVYRMHRRDGDWKVYDIVLEGVSLASTYRSSFRADVARVGLDGVIADLAERNRRRGPEG